MDSSSSSKRSHRRTRPGWVIRLKRELEALASTALAARPRFTVCTRVPSSSENACCASLSRCCL
eukprot:CAMPEP_0204431320 /NCGR_PEP_ID=MMETSP0470-20130426/64621_1 /ASSEMBLY_ACC=CAM_ASM_000385 /TAXON_ID=2969 /ORGANISM="Oxyrrhis marina" /LENGTH=63 /DNA_ID=CAMNT_0051429511 /DNA_START=147 /DNA_END=335 /DNA_ORIENTATION=-